MKVLIISIISIILLSTIIITLLNKPKPEQEFIISSSPIAQEKPNPTPEDTVTDITASFSIITGNITRSFKAEKYHNKSPDVYIENPDPSIVHVKKPGITWDDFFKTLPMKLTNDCLITGDGETLCNGKNSTLKFYLNDIETPNFLDQQIKESDKALIKYTL